MRIRLRCSCSSPIVAFRPAETRCITRRGRLGGRSCSALRRMAPGYRLWQLVFLFGGRRTSLSAACRRLRPAHPRMCGVLLSHAIRFGGPRGCASLGRWRCFGSGAMRGALLRQGVVAGDVEVRSLLQTRASPSRLFLRMRRLRRSSACTASSWLRSRLWPLWSVCEEGACCSIRAFVCVSISGLGRCSNGGPRMSTSVCILPRCSASVQLAPCLVHSGSRAVALAARVRFGARAH